MKNIFYTMVLLLLGIQTLGQAPNWTVNGANFSLDFTLIGTLYFDSAYSVNVLDQVAAVDAQGNIRGTSNVVFNPQLNSYLFYMTVFGNQSNDAIGFKMYNSNADSIYEAMNDSINFVPNQSMGTFLTPFQIYNQHIIEGIQISNDSISENQNTSHFLGTFSTQFGSPYSGNVLYQFVPGVNSTHNSSFYISNDSLFTDSTFNYETTPVVNIRISMTAGSLIEEKSFQITVSNQNDPITDITLSNDSIFANNHLHDSIGVFSCLDEDLNDFHSYSIVPNPGTHHHAFQIDGNVLKADTTFNYYVQNQYNLTVEATDSMGSTFQKNFQVYINSNNHPVTDISLSNNQVIHLNAVGTEIGNLTASDADTSDTHTFSIVPSLFTAHDKFVIIQNKLYANASFDHGTQDSYDLDIQASDSSGSSITKRFNIEVVTNLTLSDIVLDNSSFNNWNQVGDTIGNLSAIDSDTSAIHSFLVLPTDFTDHAHFGITGNTLRVKTPFTHTTPQSFNIDVECQNDKGSVFVKNILIQLNITGISIITHSNTKVYPNPTNGQFFVELDSENMNSLVQLLDVNGKVIDSYSLDQIKNGINIFHLPKGMYILQNQELQIREILIKN